MVPLSDLDTYFVEQFGSEADSAGAAHGGTFQLYATIKLERLITDKLSGVRLAL
jgi:hypothetical protein